MEMSGAAAGVLHLGNGLRRYALVFLILFLLLAVGLLYLTRTTKGRIQLRTIARKFPLSRRLMYDTSCARFASGMSVALKSGLDTEEGFDLVTQLVDDPDFCQKIASAREAIQNGEDFSDALNKAGIFSGMDAGWYLSVSGPERQTALFPILLPGYRLRRTKAPESGPDFWNPRWWLSFLSWWD